MVKHLQKRGVGLKGCPDIFDTPENNREEVLNLRVRNKDLSDSLVASRIETANWKNECYAKDTIILRLQKIIAKLKTENKELREKIEELAHLLADALRNIENEESAMEMLRVAFSQLPAGTAYDVFSGVSKLLVNNKNWRRVQSVIHQEVIERLLQIEKVLMTERQTQMNVSGDLVLNKEIKND